MKIKEIPRQARPREKAILFGLDKLDNSELLAIIIGSGTKGHSCLEIAHALLARYVSLDSLSKIPYDELKSMKGLSSVRALNLLATFTLYKRIEEEKKSGGVLELDASSIYDHLAPSLLKSDRERLYILLFNRRKKLIQEDEFYIGTKDGFEVNEEDIARRIYQIGAKYFVLVHNHPEGSLEPSDGDIFTTLSIKRKLEHLPIQFYDHLIITHEGYYSFREHGHFFSK